MWLLSLFHIAGEVVLIVHNANNPDKHCSNNYLTISPRGKAKWAIDRWPLRAKGLIVLVSPN